RHPGGRDRIQRRNSLLCRETVDRTAAMGRACATRGAILGTEGVLWRFSADACDLLQVQDRQFQEEWEKADHRRILQWPGEGSRRTVRVMRDVQSQIAAPVSEGAVEQLGELAGGIDVSIPCTEVVDRSPVVLDVVDPGAGFLEGDVRE